jgi:hypothetical protein
MWAYATVAYLVLGAVTLIPVLTASLARIKLNPGGKSFEDGPFSEGARKRLIAHWTRIEGSLGFWKKQAQKNRRLHYYVILWTVPVSVLIPIVVQSIGPSDPWPKRLVTIASAHTAILLAVHKALKVDNNFRAFRHGESEFYDAYRRLLDRPKTFGETEDEQVNSYFELVEGLRRFVRNAETDNLATLEQAETQLARKAG